MGKAGRWIKSILAGRKDGGGKKSLPQQQDGDATPLPVASSPREKKRWSFRRPATEQQQQQGRKPAAAPSPLSSMDPPGVSVSGREPDGLGQGEHAVAVAVAAAAAADAAVMAAAEAAAAVARLAAAEAEEEGDVLAICAVEEASAARIQATFRGYLARKALCALRGLVKLQALIRGQLVRRQATATLRRMQALLDAQSRLRAQRARMVDADHVAAAAAAYQRRSPQHPRRRSSYVRAEMDRSGEEHVRIVEVDVGDPARRGRSSCSAAATESRERRLAEYYCYGGGGGQCSPAPSSAAFGAELSPQRAYSGHFDDAFAFADQAAAAAGSSPYVSPYDACDGYGAVPSYMANTESSRAKARSQSAPRQRTDGAAPALERQPSRRRGAPRKTMQRSSSHIGVPAAGGACGYGYGYHHHQQQQQNPWAGVRLDRSSASLVGSECGSTSSVLTAATVGYCRSLVGFEVRAGGELHYTIL
ncbi:protein IQ-DOMAIN 14-like [Panicum miliaceum]|uniref:Protein IQ-DOMAIN 14-like n=1 Tax=Panicum miliaceum TaxID=4540 RepID=A0A3L6TNV4_PANMI|nr:protein IQ-DOMAIN 14-like [Panicum miliaceum]